MKIFYTLTDEAPALATRSFLPIVKAFTKPAGLSIEVKDISLASRILAQFSDQLESHQKHADALGELGEIAKTPNANIIKLPNISASVPQLKAAIAELQSKGFAIPKFPEDPKTDDEREVRAKYAKVLGSAVNPVLREGNSDRRVAPPVKEYAKQNPHSMGAWSSDSKTHVASMTEGDFYSSEVSFSAPSEDDVRIEFKSNDGSVRVLKESTPLIANEIIDAAVMSVSSLRKYLDREIDNAREEGVLLSLHMKATMMKVSDPIIFGEVVKSYYKPVIEKYFSELNKVGFDSRNGFGDLIAKIENLPSDKKSEILNAIDECYKTRPQLAMVNSDKGITNLHVPSDVIIDASMPAAIRSSGKMWNAAGKLQDTKALIPDRSYAGIYQETIDFCKRHGAFDPSKMGSVSNVGLMAKKAEEYGSHDKTFHIQGSGVVQVISKSGETLIEHNVEEGDIWRMCQTKDIAVRDWVKLAVARARATGTPAIFWLDENRSHDRALISRVEAYLEDHDTKGLEIQIMSPIKAVKFSLERIKNGEDTISVTGNVLRDYLTDLFPILELGTSAKMLSIVPLLAGGGLFETGAGGSAPKHVQQLVEENHLRWDSLGEFLALAVSLEDIAVKTKNKKAQVLADALTAANSRYLSENKSPSRKSGELDNRGTHYYVAKFWAEALSKQSEDSDLLNAFSKVARELTDNEADIIKELLEVQGKHANIGGYYLPENSKADATMRPSKLFNGIISSI